MSKKISALCIAAAILFSSGSAFAESPYHVGFGTSSSLGVSVGASVKANLNYDVSTQASTSAHIDYQSSLSSHHSSGHTYQSGSGYVAQAAVYQAPQIHYQAEVYQAPQIRYQAAPVVEYAPCNHCMVHPSETYAIESTGFMLSGSNRNSEVSFGLRGLGFYLSDLEQSCGGDSLEFELSGGLGIYTRFRPLRWLAFEFIADATYGKDRDSNSYLRIPLSFGLQFHAFDYGVFNFYGVAAASMTFVYTNSQGIKDDYYTFGGQFGGGLSVVLGMIELGLDARYTIDCPPGSLDTAFGKFTPKKGFQHGVLFAANIGLSF